MNSRRNKIKIGILGCGAIGSRLAATVSNKMQNSYSLTGIYDIVPEKMQSLEKKILRKKIAKRSITDLIKSSDVIVEAIGSAETRDILKRIILAKKDLIVLSSGQLIADDEMFRLARRHAVRIIIPTGAIGGIDAAKALARVGIRTISVTTRKPVKGLAGSKFMLSRQIDPKSIKRETVLFEGTVRQAVRYFPANINVAATIALATGTLNKLRVRIIASPEFKTNSHELNVVSRSGRLCARVENAPCPDNPKTSYLAVLSAVQALEQYADVVHIGT